jgi:serine/threonine-protein kinase
MATVYRAHDPQLGRDVAIKVMHGFFAGRADLEARFRREANAVATIRHPAILNVFDFVAPAGEEPGYIVSELIAGPGLRAVLDQRGGKLPPEVAVLVTARVADALGAAHAAGIVHRDVKPDNVLIDRAGGGARVVLTDFGVAHISGMDTMTATGAVLGSPAYMSPEQARSEDVGPASDVFSLGVMLYQLCTGHLPFGGKDPLAVITAILRGQYRRAGEIEPRVGPQLERVIARCLEPRPAARFPDAAALATALRDTLGDVRKTVLADEAGALRQFLDEPEVFERALAGAVTRAAVVSGESARKSGQTTRALAEAGRALAYAPDDPEAAALLSRIGRGDRVRWWVRRAGAIAAAVVLLGGVAVVWQTRPPAHEEPRLAPSALPSARGEKPSATAEVPPTPAPPVAPAAPSAVAPPAPAPPNDGATERRRRRLAHPAAPAASARSAAPSSPPSAAATVIPVAKAPDAPAPVEANAPSAHPPEKVEPVPAPPPAKASLVLRASYGFCEPSLDAQKPSLRATYNDLAPGHHDIFCTLPQGGAKVHVSAYDLRPGAKVSLVIVPGPDGRPIIGRSE